MPDKKESQSISVQKLIAEKRKKGSKKRTEKIIPFILLLTAIVSVFTTLGILFTLFS